MDIKNYFSLSCQDAALLCDKAQYKETKNREKIKLGWHFLFCKTCNKYHKDNLKLSFLLKNSHINTCSEQQKRHYKNQMREFILKQSSKQQ